MTTCLTVLTLFISTNTSVQGNDFGWLLYNKNTPFYTWYQKTTKDRIYVEYLAAATSLDVLENKSLKPDGTKCTEDGKTYSVFRLKNEIKR